jgi:hypothetical protein
VNNFQKILDGPTQNSPRNRRCPIPAPASSHHSTTPARRLFAANPQSAIRNGNEPPGKNTNLGEGRIRAGTAPPLSRRESVLGASWRHHWMDRTPAAEPAWMLLSPSLFSTSVWRGGRKGVGRLKGARRVLSSGYSLPGPLPAVRGEGIGRPPGGSGWIVKLRTKDLPRLGLGCLLNPLFVRQRNSYADQN